MSGRDDVETGAATGARTHRQREGRKDTTIRDRVALLSVTRTLGVCLVRLETGVPYTPGLVPPRRRLWEAVPSWCRWSHFSPGRGTSSPVIPVRNFLPL